MATTTYAAPVTVNEANNGSSIELRVGQTLVLTLESNPTTGYEWSYNGQSDSNITQQGEAVFAANHAEKGWVGGGGVERWTFLAIKPGSETLNFEYKRPWEKDIEPVRTVFFHVKIK